MPKPLDINRLKQFESRSVPQHIAPPPADQTEVRAERWPSREPIRDDQISIKAPLDVIERFKRMCKDDRRTYADMLTILMDGTESKG